jgi:hypothetical protein
MKNIAVKLILVFCGIWLTGDLQSQTQIFRPTGDSYIMVSGTSTIHDWEMISENISSEAKFSTNDEGQPEKLESVSFRLTKTTLKSDKSGLDRRAYEAMNAKRHPEIIFRTNGSGMLVKNDDKILIDSRGELTIAGNTRQVNVSAICINGDDKKLVCTGEQKLKMTDFNIDPPVMMLGALRTSDEITISYKIVYVQ